jgi:hypothetical protein
MCINIFKPSHDKSSSCFYNGGVPTLKGFWTPRDLTKIRLSPDKEIKFTFYSNNI